MQQVLQAIWDTLIQIGGNLVENRLDIIALEEI